MQTQIIFIIHAVITSLIVNILWNYSRKYSIPITIHNLPIIILTGLALFATTYLAATRFGLFLPTGILFAGIILTILSVDIANRPPVKLVQKILLAIFAVFFWPQLLMLLAFYMTFLDKIKQELNLRKKNVH